MDQLPPPLMRFNATTSLHSYNYIYYTRHRIRKFIVCQQSTPHTLRRYIINNDNIPFHTLEEWANYTNNLNNSSSGTGCGAIVNSESI